MNGGGDQEQPEVNGNPVGHEGSAANENARPDNLSGR